jgi:ribosome-binding protein aMBF1 (putative translation factor)
MDWQALHDEFMKLRAEEIGLTQGMKSLTVLGMYNTGDEHGVWAITETPSENLRERFNMLATHAGKKLAAPSGVSRRYFWLHRLYHHLKGIESEHLNVADDTGGLIERVTEASATFCAVLKARELEREDRTQHEYNFLRIKEALQEPPQIKHGPESAPISEEPTPIPLSIDSESVGAQIDRLRERCRWDIETLAEKVNLDPSSVSRHIGNKASPQLKRLGAYERVFSNRLGENIVINKTPRKRK